MHWAQSLLGLVFLRMLPPDPPPDLLSTRQCSASPRPSPPENTNGIHTQCSAQRNRCSQEAHVGGAICFDRGQAWLALFCSSPSAWRLNSYNCSEKNSRPRSNKKSTPILFFLCGEVLKKASFVYQSAWPQNVCTQAERGLKTYALRPR